ncbi:phage integrase N-terminal SAM-like domain-containing protein [Spongiibacter sp. IMCC21906]|uniref:phage integrase N-terminal SAM-like domain-containing protein n=1 Tax=Spongiibacter sp. IMCC21906 TaxID=1620392 RepID=UPI0012E03BAD|nr:phage integrase N-terminal SAM-like domain-containing protein [Spongiibacter sp. IMCC21906]
MQIYWILYFIRFHNKVHPSTLGGEAVKQFLEFLALKHNEVRDLNSSTAQVP